MCFYEGSYDMDVIGVGASIAGFLSYYNTLDAGFVYDDRRAILNNQDVLPSTPLSSLWYNDFWGTPISSSGSHGSYRPLCVLSFRLNYILGGGYRPYGFHLINVLLHTLCTFLVVKLARIFFQNNFPVFVCGFLFSLHPIHTEAVAGIVGRADIAACIFYIISFLSYVKHVRFRVILTNYKSYYKYPKINSKYLVYVSDSEEKSSGYLWFQCTAWLVLCLIASACAMLSKESGLTVLVVCGVYDVVTNCRSIKHFFTKKKHRGQLASMCTLGFVLFGLLLLRVLLMGAKPPVFASSDNPSSRCPSSLTRTLTFLYLPSFNFFLFIYPKWLSFDWSMDAIPRISTVFDVRNLMTFFFYYFVYKILRSYVKKLTGYRLPESRLEDLPKCQVCKTFLNQHINSKTLNNNNNNNNYLKFSSKELVYMYRSAYQKSKCDCSKCLKIEFLQLKYKNWIPMNNRASWQNGSAFSSISGKSGSQVILLSLAFLIVPFIPATNLFFYVGFVVAERVLYIPSIGYCLLISFGCNLLYKRTNKKAVILCATFVLFFVCAVRTIIRNNDWYNEESLYRSGIPVNPPKYYYIPETKQWIERDCQIPDGLGKVRLAQQKLSKKICLPKSAFQSYRSAKDQVVIILHSNYGEEYCSPYLKENLKSCEQLELSYGNLGSILNAQGRGDEAEAAYRMALKHRPNMAEVYYNLGVLQQGRMQYNEAIQSYHLAIQYRPSLALAHLNLGQLLASQGRCEEAATVLRRCSQLDGTGLKDQKQHQTTKITALLHLGRLFADQGRYQKAVSVYLEAVNAMPHFYQPQVLYNLLGDAYSQLKQTEEAEKWYKAALQAKPDHVPAHLTYGKLLAKNRTRISEAEQWFLKAKKLAPSEPAVYQHFGQFLSELERHSEAAVHYVRAAELAPGEYEAVVNAATALRQADRKVEAEKYYRQAVQLRPEDARSHSNLGAMLHLNGKYKEAAQSYKLALKLQPGDVTTLANLHKLKSLMKKLET